MRKKMKGNKVCKGIRKWKTITQNLNIMIYKNALFVKVSRKLRDIIFLCISFDHFAFHKCVFLEFLLPKTEAAPPPHVPRRFSVWTGDSLACGSGGGDECVNQGCSQGQGYPAPSLLQHKAL